MQRNTTMRFVGYFLLLSVCHAVTANNIPIAFGVEDLGKGFDIITGQILSEPVAVQSTTAAQISFEGTDFQVPDNVKLQTVDTFGMFRLTLCSSHCECTL